MVGLWRAAHPIEQQIESGHNVPVASPRAGHRGPPSWNSRVRRAAGPQRLSHRCDRRLHPAPTPGRASPSCAVISWSGDGCAGGCVDGYGDHGLWCTCPIRSGRGRMARSIRSRRHLLSIFSDGPVDHQHRHSSLETPRKLRRMSEKSHLVTAQVQCPSGSSCRSFGETACCDSGRAAGLAVVEA